jgi:hypothetical protein
MMIVQALSAARSLRLAIYNRRLRWLVQRRAIRAVLLLMMMVVVMQMVFTARHQFRIRRAAAAIARV